MIRVNSVIRLLSPDEFIHRVNIVSVQEQRNLETLAMEKADAAIYNNVPALVTELVGSALLAARQRHPQVSVSVQFRYLPNVYAAYRAKALMVVVFGDRRLEVVSPPLFDARKTQMLLDCREVL